MVKIILSVQALLISAALATSAHAQSFLTNGLVAYYPFNGNANDATANGNNGIVQGATLTTNRFGAPNSAYAFNGVQNRIQIPETIFSATNSQITISMWVTTDSGSYSGNGNIFEKSSVNGEMDLVANANQFVFGPVLSNPYGGVNVGTPITPNSLTHLVGVYQQGQGIWLYTNGVLASSLTGIPNSTLWVDRSGYPLVSAIGIYDFTPGPFNAFHGVIDDVRVYTRALSASEVQQLYQYEAFQQPGVALGLYPGVLVSGIVGYTYNIQSNPDLVNSNGWTTVTNLTLTQPVQLWVDTSNNAALPANPHRFYRVLAVP